MDTHAGSSSSIPGLTSLLVFPAVNVAFLEA